jgi:hypothetical protein
MHGLPDRTRKGKQTGSNPSYSLVALLNVAGRNVSVTQLPFGTERGLFGDGPQPRCARLWGQHPTR